MSGLLVYTNLLAADRVYLSPASPRLTVGSYPTPFTLTINDLNGHTGGIVSVALSLELPPVAVSNCRVLCCPDFPPVLNTGDCSINCRFLLYPTCRNINWILTVLLVAIKKPPFEGYLVGMTRLELATSRPPAVRATNCATSRLT